MWDAGHELVNTRTWVISSCLTALPPYTCRWMGLPYRDGDNFPAGDGCNTFTCRRGSVSCTAMLKCPAVG